MALPNEFTGLMDELLKQQLQRVLPTLCRRGWISAASTRSTAWAEIHKALAEDDIPMQAQASMFLWHSGSHTATAPCMPSAGSRLCLASSFVRAMGHDVNAMTRPEQIAALDKLWAAFNNLPADNFPKYTGTQMALITRYIEIRYNSLHEA